MGAELCFLLPGRGSRGKLGLMNCELPLKFSTWKGHRLLPHNVPWAKGITQPRLTRSVREAINPRKKKPELFSEEHEWQTNGRYPGCHEHCSLILLAVCTTGSHILCLSFQILFPPFFILLSPKGWLLRTASPGLPCRLVSCWIWPVRVLGYRGKSKRRLLYSVDPSLPGSIC